MSVPATPTGLAFDPATGYLTWDKAPNTEVAMYYLHIFEDNKEVRNPPVGMAYQNSITPYYQVHCAGTVKPGHAYRFEVVADSDPNYPGTAATKSSPAVLSYTAPPVTSGS